MAIWFADLYFRDGDKRKLMFVLAFGASSVSFFMLVTGMESLESNTIVRNIFQWANMPIIVAVFIAANESFYNVKDFDRIFKLFLGCFALFLVMIIVPLNLEMILVYSRQLLAIEIIIVSVYFYFKWRGVSSLMFLFSIICFSIGGISMRGNFDYLSIFAFFMAYMFLGLIFIYTGKIQDKQGVGPYFSLKYKLETLEKELKGSEEKFQSILENAPNIIMIVDRDGIIQYINRMVPGFKNKITVGTKVTDFTKPEFQALENAAITQAFKGGKICSYIVKGAGSKAREAWYETKIAPIKQAGRIENVVMISTDVTDLKQAENQLEEKIVNLEKKELETFNIMKNLNKALAKHKHMEKVLKLSEEKYRDLFENANDLILSVDKDGKFKYVNRKWLNLLGYTKEEVQSLTLIDIIRKDKTPHCMEIFKRVCNGESFENVETVFVAKDGREIIVEGSVNARFKDGKFEGARTILHDITDRKLVEKELHQTVRESERFNRLAVGREHRMIELKQEVNDLLYAIGQDTKYNLPTPGNIMNKIGG